MDNVSYVDRVKLPFTYDVEKLKSEVNRLVNDSYEYYKVIPLRAPAHQVDTTLPPPPPAEDYADGSWTKWLNTKELDSSPYLREIVSQWSEITTVNLVRLLFLAPKSIVPEHRDVTLALEEHKSMIRLTIPIINEEGVRFYLNNSSVEMNLGECWYLKLSDPHRVENNGNHSRINLTIDIIPNEMVRKLIQKVVSSNS